MVTKIKNNETKNSLPKGYRDKWNTCRYNIFKAVTAETALENYAHFCIGRS